MEEAAPAPIPHTSCLLPLCSFVFQQCPQHSTPAAAAAAPPELVMEEAAPPPTEIFYTEGSEELRQARLEVSYGKDI